MGSNGANWSELLPDILIQIAGTLKTRQDLHCFRSVCRNWRLISSPLSLQTLPLLHPLLPLTVPPADGFSFFSRHSSSLLTLFATYLVRPKPHPPGPAQAQPQAQAQSWIVTVEESTRGKLRIRSPLTPHLVECLPGGFPMCVDMYDYDVSLVASGYCVKELNYDRYSLLKVFWFENWGTILVLLDQVWQGWLSWGNIGGRMVLLARVQCDQCDQCDDRRLDDIVEFGSGVIYAVDRNGRVFTIRDWGYLRMECVAHGLIFSGRAGDRRKRLVVDAFGVLYLVYRDVCNGDHIILRFIGSIKMDVDGTKLCLLVKGGCFLWGLIVASLLRPMIFLAVGRIASSFIRIPFQDMIVMAFFPAIPSLKELMRNLALVCFIWEMVMPV